MDSWYVLLLVSVKRHLEQRVLIFQVSLVVVMAAARNI